MGADKKRKVRGKKRKPGTATIQTKKAAAAGRDPQIGHAERIESFTKRALELKRDDMIHAEIAEIIAREFELVAIPSLGTISNWLNGAYKATEEEIKQLQFQTRIDDFKRLERMIAKLMAIALADEIEIQRWKMVEGTLQPFLDEDALAEQMEATKTIVKLMERKARLLGIDLAKAIDDKKGEGPTSLQDLQIWMINQINYGTAHGAPLDDAKPVLELKSGLEDQI